MAFTVLGARPFRHGVGSARHLPPAILDVLAPHVRDFARALAVSRITLSAVPAINPASSNADQNRGTSLSESTRSRLSTSLRSTSLQGFSFSPPISSLIAHEKIADAAASAWLATTGAETRA